jgi:serine/threonine protein phosphatase 1
VRDLTSGRVQRFARNTRGRDYVAGDPHGCYSHLAAALVRAGFDESRDRLFLTGDLVNKGPYSDASLGWLKKPWCRSARGNHDQMVIDACTIGVDRDWHISRGGAWFYTLPEARQQQYADVFQSLPVAMEIETDDGLIGIVHSEVIGSWQAYVRELIQDAWPVTGQQLIGRTRIKTLNTAPVEGLHMLIVGHTRVPGVLELGNTYYIDTGCYRTDVLTVLAIDEIRASVVRSYNHESAAVG